MKRDHVLLSALFFSAIWHLFWLSALTVVVVPKDVKAPKFSSVSFLGPILEQSILEVRSAVHECSVPEKRYFSEIGSSSAFIGEKTDLDAYIDADPDGGADILEFDEILAGLAILAIDGNKMEPDNSQ